MSGLNTTVNTYRQIDKVRTTTLVMFERKAAEGGNRRVAFKLCVPRVELVGAPQNQARSFRGDRQ